MTTRQRHYPDMKRGTTVCLITDTHVGAAGNADWLSNWILRMRDDLISLKDSVHGFIDTGDCIHWDVGSDQPAEDLEYTSVFRDPIMQQTGLPFGLVGGNHDYDSFDANDPGASRTSLQWAADLGWLPEVPPEQTAANSVLDIGDYRFLLLSPDSKPTGVNGWWFSDTTLQWAHDQLDAAGDRKVVIADHCPVSLQYSGNPNDYSVDYSNPGFMDLFGQHANAYAFLSGHIHVFISNRNHARVLNFGGRNVFSINGPPAGGGRGGSVAYADHQWQNPCMTTFITFDGDTCTVRWRDHLRRQWATSQGAYSLTLTLPADPGGGGGGGTTYGFGSGPFGSGAFGGTA